MIKISDRLERSMQEALNLEFYLQESCIPISKIKHEASNIYCIFEKEDWELCLYGFSRKECYEYVLKYSRNGYVGGWVEIGFGDEDLEKHLMNYDGLNGPSTKIYCSQFGGVGPTNFDRDEHLISKEKAVKFIRDWLKNF